MTVKVEDVPPDEGKVTPKLDLDMSRRLGGAAFLAALLSEKVIEAREKTPLKIATGFGDVVVTLDVDRKPQPAPLKPCPFCGEEPHVRNSWNVEEQRPDEVVWCRHCNIHFDRAAWNRRES